MSRTSHVGLVLSPVAVVFVVVAWVPIAGEPEPGLECESLALTSGLCGLLIREVDGEVDG